MRRLTQLSLLWKILLSTSIALTLLFGVTGWIAQDNAVRAISQSVDGEVRASFQAYDSLWRSRVENLASISLVLSRMSDVRAAFSTGDRATIRDTAAEVWNQVSDREAIFIVTDPSGKVLASLGGVVGRDLGQELQQDLQVVHQAAAAFPKQTSGFLRAGDRLYQVSVTPIYVQAGAGLGLLDVLVAGYAVDQDVAGGLKEATGGSDFCFLAGETVIASTLSSEPTRQIQMTNAKSGDLSRIDAAGIPYTMLQTPLLDVEGKSIGELRILRSFESARASINALRRNIVLVWLFAMLLGLWLTYNLARRILKPVGELDRAAAEVARGNYDYRVPQTSKHDELGRLAEAFNAMCASIEGGRQELIRQERITTIGRLSTSIVHDLRNPLAAIYGGAEMLIDRALPMEQVQRLANNIYRSSRRMQQLLQELVDAGRGKTTGSEVCNLKEIVDAAYEVHSATADAQSVQVNLDVAPEIELPLDRARMERVFINLIDNAMIVMPKGGTLDIQAQPNGAAVLVRIQDSGPGIAPQIRGQLFQPFVTAGKKNGVGLGLAFSRQTVLDHGGELWEDSARGAGACFFMKLPLERHV